MRCGRCVLGLLLVLSMGACRQAASTPGVLPTGTVTPPGASPTGSLLPPAATTTLPTTFPEGDASVPDEIGSARDDVLAYVAAHHSGQAPVTSLTWTGERTTPAGMLGAETYRYSSDSWLVTISHPVVPPDKATYQVAVSNSETGFGWQGEVTSAGDVTEFSTIENDPVLSARDYALAYIAEQYGGLAPEADLTWTRSRMTPEGLVGAETYQYRAGFWVVTVSYPVVAPELTRYRVLVSNDSTGFQCQGEVLADGTVSESTSPVTGLPVVGWYGQVVKLPDGAQYDDYLALHPEGTGAVGLTGADLSVEDTIEGLRESGAFAHFWGSLVCGVPDYNECQLTVSRLRADAAGPPFEPDPVARWEGTIWATPAGATFDDYFELAGDYPILYGIDATDPALAMQIEDLRDTHSPIRVWGRLTCGVPDINSSQISVIAIEVLAGLAPPEPTEVDGWIGRIVRLGTGAEFDDYFEREDGRRYGIDAAGEDMQQRIQALETVGSRIRVWGQLVTDVPDVEGRQIQLERYELEKAIVPIEGWVGRIVALEPGAQYDDYFEREDGQRYGIDTPDPKLARRVEALRDATTRVRVWGELLQDIPDVETRQIRVSEIEVAD